MEHLNSVTSGEGAKSPASLTPLTDALAAHLLDKFRWCPPEGLIKQLGDDLETMTRLARKLEAGRAELIERLRDAREFIDGQIDVVDGSYGEPRPNRAMYLAQEIDAALSRLSETPATTDEARHA